MSVDKDDISNIIELKENEIENLTASRIIDDSDHLQIIKEFNKELDSRTLNEQKELIQTLIREVESTVQNNEKNKGEGEISITYICDDYL